MKQSQRKRSRRQVLKQRPRRANNDNRILVHHTKANDFMYPITEKTFVDENPKAHKIPRLMFTPECIITDLTYPDTTVTRTNIGFNTLSWRYRANSIFDPDPALLSGPVPGYSYYAGGYGAYIVLALGYSITVSNAEVAPVDVVVWPSQTDLGLNFISTNEAFGNPHASQGTLSAKGGQDRILLTGTVDLGSFYGSVAQYLANFGSAFGANASPLFLNIGGYNSALFTAAGLDVRVTLTYRTAVFKRLFLNT
jgi:hypothetical protein